MAGSLNAPPVSHHTRSVLKSARRGLRFDLWKPTVAARVRSKSILSKSCAGIDRHATALAAHAEAFGVDEAVADDDGDVKSGHPLVSSLECLRRASSVSLATLLSRPLLSSSATIARCFEMVSLKTLRSLTS
jgi:hypothetical protein